MYAMDTESRNYISEWQSGVKIGDYTLDRKVGSGGFAEVWKAERQVGEDLEVVALKIPNLSEWNAKTSKERNDFQSAIQKEYSFAQGLKSDHILNVRDFHPDFRVEIDKGRFLEVPYLIMEYSKKGALPIPVPPTEL